MELVLAPVRVVSPVEDHAAEAPGEAAVDDVSREREPALEVGIDELAAFESHVPEVTDARSVEAAIAEERAAAGEWEPVDADTREKSYHEAAVVGVKPQERRPEKSTRLIVTWSSQTFGVAGSNRTSSRSSVTRVSSGQAGPSTSRTSTRTSPKIRRRGGRSPAPLASLSESGPPEGGY